MAKKNKKLSEDDKQLYKISRALELGYTPDSTGHMSSRDYTTGMVLKYPAHPTFQKGIKADKKLGYSGLVDPMGNIYTISPDDLPEEGFFSPNNIKDMNNKKKFGHTKPYSTAPYNTFKCGGYAKPPKHAIGAVIGAAGLAMNVMNTIKARRDQNIANNAAKSQRNAQLLEEDRFLLEDYPVEGNDIRGLYKKGGMMYTDPYKANGGDLVQLSEGMDLVKGNTHEENNIDNTYGVKLTDATGQPVAEVEDQEVIKDDKKVYSDRLYVKKGVTYAQEAERIAKMIGKADSTLNDPNTKFRKKNVAKIQKQNWEKAADDLFKHQEEMKVKKGITEENTEGIPKGQFGVNLAQGLATKTGVFANMPSMSTPNNFDFNQALPFLDNVSNAILTATTPKPKFPMLARQRKLKTDFNINPQLQDVTDTVNQVTQGIERGTSSSNVAQNRTTAAKLAGMKEKGRLFAQKENVETQLENQDVLNKQQVETQNLARISNFQDDMLQRSYNVQGRIAGNVANLVEDVNKQQHADALERYQNEQLDTISKTYDVEGTSLREQLDNPIEVDSLRSNQSYREMKAGQYLKRDTNGNYVNPREAERFLLMFPEYR